MLAFGLPFLLVVLADLQRDLYFALYVASCSCSSGCGRGRRSSDRWGPAGVHGFSASRGRRTTLAEYVGAILRRGIVYGAADSVLLPVSRSSPAFGLFASKERADAGDAEPARHRDRALPRT